MIATGPIFLHLRSKMLGFYPDGIKVSKEYAPTFADWLTSGTFTVRGVSASGIVIECAPVEIASVFLRDVERLMNHCVEHALEMHRFGVDDQIRSDAWNVVTIYYYCFFAAQALLRLIGEPVSFLDKSGVRALSTLAGSGTSPGAGVFEFAQTGSPSVSLSEYTFTKRTRRPHEATWKRLLDLFDSFIHDMTLATDAKELSLFASLATRKLFRIYTDYDWLSRVRYSANYIPGYAYLLVDRTNKAKTKKLFETWKRVEERQIESVLRSTVDNCVCSADNDSFKTHVHLLHDIGNVLFVLVKLLYRELKLRRNCDKRWDLRRARLVQDAGIPEEDYKLLFAA